MPKFGRSFSTQALVEWCEKNPVNTIEALFKRWALPGQEASEKCPLRVAVRHNYVNFYVKGQSVAKLSVFRGVPKLEVHEAYVGGRIRGASQKSMPAGQNYRRYDAKTLADPATAALISSWIKTAATYAGTEKRFVDDLVARNPSVIDLEMALPVGDLPGGSRAAPRMDLVVAQVAADTPPSIAFWEAKCANNSELRSTKAYEDFGPNGFVGPKVLDQVRKYVGWLEADHGRITSVSEAYRDTARTLLDLKNAFCADKSDMTECVRIWTELSEADKPAIVVRPGIVIGNYWPEGDPKSMSKDEEMARCATTFAENGHREELHRNGVRLHEVGPDSGDPALPLLELVRQAA